MLKIWGRGSSVNVQKVLWAAEELGLAYEHVPLGGPFGGLDSPAYRAMNPNGLVPTLQDSDGSLHWESNAIVRYLAGRYGAGTLWPADPVARSEADRWMDWLPTTLGEPMRVLFWGFVRDPVHADLNAMTAAESRLAELWGRVDAHLANQPFLGGDRLTMGDIPLGCHVQRWLRFPITRPDLPHLLAWHGRLATRPGYARHVMVAME
ncbi:glutathione S-transferase family protein [Ferrovibrio sp.]|uniref:glutathione S-transferase family protein n=1 Tax=Ferrovibrio sp. TaxID=1917215 RepID=UPI0026306CC5|nr:glutathione S-transferase family protein [Ferrovibrio sp.]